MKTGIDITLKDKTLKSIIEALQEAKDKYSDFFELNIDELQLGIELDDFISTSTGYQKEIPLLQVRFKK